MTRESKRHNKRCKHFTGVQHPTCKAGVRYNDFRAGIQEKGFPGWLPCMSTDTDCDLREFPTDEEEAESEAAFAREFEFVAQARERITFNLGHEPGHIDVECPKCGSVLHGSLAENGHTHGRCSRGGCLLWME